MRTWFVVSLLVLSLGFYSCSQRDSESLWITSTMPTGVVAQSGVLQFAFSRSVVPPESTNVWLNTSYIEFTPAIEGKFVWQDTSRLIFSPDAALPGDTKFKGKLNGTLLATTAHAKRFVGDEEFSFFTEPFTIKSIDFFYDRIDNKRTVGIKANIEFTYTVNPADVGSYLKIKMDGDEVKTFKVMSSAVNKVVPLEIATTVQYGKEREIKVSVDNKLVSPETKTAITLEKPFVFKLPAMEDLRIYGHEFGYDGTESWIRIKTSQEIDAASIKQYIELTPSRQYTVEAESKLSFRLKGKFEPGTSFHLVVKKGLESLLGAKTQNDYEADIVIGNVTPAFRFGSSSGSYMLLSGMRSVEIKTVNMDSLKVRVSQIFQNNLVHFLDGGRHYDYYYDDEGGDEGYHRKFRFFLGNYGRIIEETKLSIANSTNQEVTTLFDLSPYLKTDYKGFYLIEIAKPDESWRWTSKLVSLSDIGLIVKRSEQELIVFAVSLSDNHPMSGVNINLISTNNQTMASVKTDGDGLAKFYDFAKLSEDFTLKLITAERDNDFNFLNLSDYRIETSRFDVSGKNDIQGLYDAFLYGDRNLYRPGEKIYASGIVRSLTNTSLENMPVKVEIYNPRAYMVTELQTKLNEQGSFEINYQTLETAPTGEYRIDLRTGDGIFLTSYKVSVEDFVPDRLKVSVKPSTESARAGEEITYDLLALNFFGPPASGRNVEFEATFEPQPYRSKRFPEFWFADQGAKAYSANPYVEKLETDKEGKASVSFKIPSEVTATGVLSLKGLFSVFDESGRPVHQITRTTVYPKEYFMGIRNYLDYYVAPNSPLKVQLIAVDPDDKPIKDFKAHVEIIRREWHSVLRMSQNNTLRYVSEQREIVDETRDVVLKETPTDFLFTVKRSGDYVLHVSKSGEEGYNQISFYAYSWGSTDMTSFEIDPEARVDIVLDKSSYAPDEKAKVLFQTPFSGKLLVTVERNKIYSYKYLDVEKNSASMEINIEEQFLPNVYISAVLFRKVKDLNIPLMAGHGFVPLMIEKPSNKLNVVIDAPEKIRPRTKQKVKVSIPNEKNVFLTLAAVDEGICQVKNYRTPDPYSYFYAKKALETETFDFFRDLIPEPKKKSSTGGGDFEKQRSLQVNPLSVKRFKPVALWSGIVKTNSDGNVEITLDIPDFSGELRMMALAYKNERYGSAQKSMKVADPVVLSPALPRFLSPGDVITMPVTVFNTTDKPVSLKLEVVTEGGISAVQQSASLDIEANQEKFAPFTLKASDQIGKAAVKVQTRALGEKIESVTELAVRPISPFVVECTSGFAEAGKVVTAEIPDVFLPYGRHGHVVLSPFPVANFAKELKHLVGYPHGCLEQTTSKAFPQIFLRDIALLLDPSIIEKGSPSYFVNEAINKISGMQLANGSFSYWPGGDYTNEWATVYATHFLVEAKKAGYAVGDGILNPALNFIKTVARDRKTYDYYYYGNNQTLVKRIADKTSIYALYILALAGQPDQTLMNFYRTSKSLLTNDTQYLLAGAFALSGDRKAYLEILPPQFVTEEAGRTSGGCFDSPIRATGLMLNVLLETDPNNPNIGRYMEYLSGLFKKYYWYTTQEEAFALLGFGKAARRAGGVKVKGSVTIGGKQIAYDGGNKKISIDQFGGNVTISLQGEGRIYYSIVQEGIRKDGKVRIEDKNLRMRRQFFDRLGNAASLDGIKQNSLLIVKLTIQSDINDLENVAISDLLPAGFEIENPRLAENSQYSFTADADQPVYVDIRDDRINYYTNFENDREKKFYYLVRAVTRGEFNYAPVVGEAMYDADYYSASGGGKVRIGE
ncbi:MAG: alpha-2-macroglobulin [Bacteroidota bacterium]